MKISQSKPLRSQASRDRILLEARRLFAHEGYEKTTIRDIADAAAIHPSMIMRYYRTKEELFTSAVHIDFRMPDLAAVKKGHRGVTLIAHILDAWEGPGARDQLHILLRAAGTHEAARKRLVELVEQQALPVIRAAMQDQVNVDVRLGLVLIQLAGLVLSRYFLKYGAVLALERDTIIAEVGASVQRLLAR